MPGRLNALLLAVAILVGQVLAAGSAVAGVGGTETVRREARPMARAGCCQGACCCDAGSCPCVDRAPATPTDDHPPIAPNQPRERAVTLLLLEATSDTQLVLGDAGSQSAGSCSMRLRCALSGRERLERISRWTT